MDANDYSNYTASSSSSTVSVTTFTTPEGGGLPSGSVTAVVPPLQLPNTQRITNLALPSLHIPQSQSVPSAPKLKNIAPLAKTTGSKTESKTPPVQENDYERYDQLRCLKEKVKVLSKLLSSFPNDAKDDDRLDADYLKSLKRRIDFQEKARELVEERIAVLQVIFKAIDKYLNDPYLHQKINELPLDAPRLEGINIITCLAILERRETSCSATERGLILGIKQLLQDKMSTMEIDNEIVDISAFTKDQEDQQLILLAQSMKYEQMVLLQEKDLDFQAYSIKIETRYASKYTKSRLQRALQKLQKIIKEIETHVNDEGLPSRNGALSYASILQEGALNILKQHSAGRLATGSGEVYKLGNRFVFKPIRGAPGQKGNKKGLAHLVNREDLNRLGFPLGEGLVREHAVSLLGFGPHCTLATLPLHGSLREKGLLVEFLPNIIDLQELYDLTVASVNILFIKQQAPIIQDKVKKEEESQKEILTNLHLLTTDVDKLTGSNLGAKVDEVLTLSKVLYDSKNRLAVLIKEQQAHFAEFTTLQSKLAELGPDQRTLVEMCVKAVPMDPLNNKRPRLSIRDLAIWNQISKNSIQEIFLESLRIPNCDMNASNFLLCPSAETSRYDLKLIDRDQAFPDTWQAIQPFAWLGSTIGEMPILTFEKEIDQMDPKADLEFLKKHGITFDRPEWIQDPNDISGKKIFVGMDAPKIIQSWQYVAKICCKLAKTGHQITINDFGTIICRQPKKARSFLQELFSSAQSDKTADPSKTHWENFDKLVEREILLAKEREKRQAQVDTEKSK